MSGCSQWSMETSSGPVQGRQKDTAEKEPSGTGMLWR
jgi:hypothetical protein